MSSAAPCLLLRTAGTAIVRLSINCCCSRSHPFPPASPHALQSRHSTSSASVTTASKPTRNKTPALTLEHFLLRQRVLGLYRTIIRGLQALPRDAAQRSELRAYARGEFERHREVSDAGKIRYLVSTGKTEFDGLSRYLGEMGGR